MSAGDESDDRSDTGVALLETDDGGAGPATIERPGSEPGIDIKIGASVGRYCIEERIGSGGMGVVFRARDPELDRHVAIKLLHGGGKDRAAYEARLVREAQAMARVSHENLAVVHDVGHTDNGVFVAMELIDGRTMSEWLAEDERSVEERIAALASAGRGLAAAHSCAVIHRDFKPDNVMVSHDGRIKVVDFGLARKAVAFDPGAALDATAPATQSDVRLTMTGTLMGTPAYMAPEQWRAETADERADQFSFAVAAWEVLAGKRPFAGATLAALSAAVKAGEIDPAAKIGLSPAILQVLSRALALDPNLRWPSLSVLVEKIESTATIRRGRWLWPAAAAAIALALGGAYFGLAGGDEAAEGAAQPQSGAHAGGAIEADERPIDARIAVSREDLKAWVVSPDVSFWVRTVPFSANGKLEGYKLYAITPDSPFGRLGVENGDRIIELDGKAIVNHDAIPSILSRIAASGATEFRLLLERDHKIRVHVYQVEVGAGSGLIREVRISGNVDVPTEHLLSGLADIGVAPDAPFQRASLDRVNGQIISVYYERGYINATSAPPTFTPNREMGGVDVWVNVSEGELFRIGKIRVEGKLTAPEEEYRALTEIERGDVYRRSDVANAIRRLQAHRRGAGVRRGTIQPRTSIDTARRIVDLVFVLD